jgi:hypothetical protein
LNAYFVGVNLRIVTLLVLLSSTACAGTTAPRAIPDSNAMPQTLQAAVHHRAPMGGAQVLLTLPAIAPAQPVPTPGIVFTRLSSATQSVAGTFGSSKIPAIVLSSQTTGCAESSDGLTCTVALSIPVGTARLTLYTYASPDGKGKPLATASERLTVSAANGQTVSPQSWLGIAASYKLAFSKKRFHQGVPSSTVISLYAIDAARAIIPSNQISGPSGKPLHMQLHFVGAYPEKLALPDDLPFTSVTFPYDGRLSGSSSINAIAMNPNSKTVYATATLRFTQGLVGPGQLFVQGTGATTSDPERLLQFAPGASGTDAPLRIYNFGGGPIWANAQGEFWAGPFDSGDNDSSASWLEKYDANGEGIERITPAPKDVMLAAAVDPNENVYTIEGQVDDDYGCSLIAGTVRVYSAAGGWQLTRRFPLSGNSCSYEMAADANGDIFVGSYTSGAATVQEYAPSSNTYVPTTQYTLPPTSVIGIAVDSQGNLFVQSFGTLLEYPKSGGQQSVLPGTVIGRFALDAHDNLYLSSYGIVYEYAPGQTSPLRTVALFGYGEGTVQAIAAGP